MHCPCSPHFVSLHVLFSVDNVQKAKMLRWIIFSCHLLQASCQCWRPQCRLRRWWRPQAAWSPGREGTAPASGPASVPIESSILRSNHSQCKEPIPKIQKTNITRIGIARPQSQFPHSCVCEWFIYSHNPSVFSAARNMWTDPGNIYFSCSAKNKTNLLHLDESIRPVSELWNEEWSAVYA